MHNIKRKLRVRVRVDLIKMTKLMMNVKVNLTGKHDFDSADFGS